MQDDAAQAKLALAMEQAAVRGPPRSTARRLTLGSHRRRTRRRVAAIDHQVHPFPAGVVRAWHAWRDAYRARLRARRRGGPVCATTRCSTSRCCARRRRPSSIRPSRAPSTSPSRCGGGAVARSSRRQTSSTGLLQTGFRLLSGMRAKPRPQDNAVIVLVVLGGITCLEIKAIQARLLLARACLSAACRSKCSSTPASRACSSARR